MKDQIACVFTVYVVFDVYRLRQFDQEPQNPEREREKRGIKCGHEFRNIKAEDMILQWQKFLSYSKNKSLLIKFIKEKRTFIRVAKRGIERGSLERQKL